MKQVCLQSLLAAVLLAAFAVPVVGNAAKAAERSPGRTVQAPTVLATGFPTPWPCTGKSCKLVVGESRTVTASGLPVPWPCTGKSCKLVVGEPRTVIANGFPTPWPCDKNKDPKCKYPCCSLVMDGLGAGTVSPTQIATGFPTPWPCTGKSCASVVTEMPLVVDGAGEGASVPTQIATGFPTPWPCNAKSCASVLQEMPTRLATGFPAS